MNIECVTLEMFVEMDVVLKKYVLSPTWTKIWICQQILMDLLNVQACYIGQTGRIGRWWWQEVRYCKILDA